MARNDSHWARASSLLCQRCHGLRAAVAALWLSVVQVVRNSSCLVRPIGLLLRFLLRFSCPFFTSNDLTLVAEFARLSFPSWSASNAPQPNPCTLPLSSDFHSFQEPPPCCQGGRLPPCARLPGLTQLARPWLTGGAAGGEQGRRPAQGTSSSAGPPRRRARRRSGKARTGRPGPG